MRAICRYISDMKTTKERLASIAAIAAIGFGIAGTAIPPHGIIDKSMLYLIAQLLIFSATLLGFGHTIEKVTEMVNDIKNRKKEDNV